MTRPSIPAGTRIGHVHLKVVDLDRAVAFYHDRLGFERIARFGEDAAFVSADGHHHHLSLNTWESRGGAPSAGSTGLSHFVINYPGWRDQAVALKQLLDAGPAGASSKAPDHGAHEAIYLHDPDSYGIELAWDRPQEDWPRPDGELVFDRISLDFTGLLRELGDLAAERYLPDLAASTSAWPSGRAGSECAVLRR